MLISVFKMMLKIWSKLYFFTCCVSFLEEYDYYYYYNSSIALNLKQCYSKRFTVHKIQYTCTIKHISRIDIMR
jgi:hypothetical protein